MELADVIRELHACMYPERYYTPAELEQRGIVIDETIGAYQWDADTLDALADVFSKNAGTLAGIIK